MKIFSKWFWSKASAQKAAARMEKKGFSTKVSFSMATDGRSDWLLEVFDK